MPALLRRAGDRAAAPIRGPASLLYGGAAVKRSGAPLRLFGRSLPGAVPRFSPPRAAGLTRPGRREQPKKSRAHGQVVALRKRNYSVYEISQTLKEQGTPLSATAVREMLAAEGFAPLPRRLDEERPVRVGPNAQAVANCGDCVLSPREFTTRTGGLFLFVPDLVRLDSDALAQAAKLPGSRMVPSAHALRASLALKLWA